MSNIQFEIDPIHYLIAAIALLGSFYRFFVKPKLDKWNAILENVNKIPAIAGDIVEIKKELYPNGGGSMRDGLDRVENRLVSIEMMQDIYLKDAKHGVFETDSAGKWTEVNRTLCRMLTCTEKELLGNGWMSYIDQDAIDRFHHAFANEIELKLVTKMKTNDDKTMIVSITANPLRSNMNKKLIGYLGTVDETIA
jgi:PAS domain S-box-containing protein